MEENLEIHIHPHQDIVWLNVQEVIMAYSLETDNVSKLVHNKLGGKVLI